jgi:hypothetical protein
MPIRHDSPKPQKFPCRIGIDHWLIPGRTGRSAQVIYKYTDAEADMDEDGWVDPALWVPLPYDMVRLKLERKVINGWWTGLEWFGHRLQEKDKVLYWKYEHAK